MRSSGVPTTGPTAEELEILYSSLGAEDRHDLPQEIQSARAKGEAGMAAVVDAWLLDDAAPGTHRRAPPGGNHDPRVVTAVSHSQRRRVMEWGRAPLVVMACA